MGRPRARVLTFPAGRRPALPSARAATQPKCASSAPSPFGPPGRSSLKLTLPSPLAKAQPRDPLVRVVHLAHTDRARDAGAHCRPDPGRRRRPVARRGRLAVRVVRDRVVPADGVRLPSLSPFCPSLAERADLKGLLSRAQSDIDLVIESAAMDKQNKVSVLHTLAAVLRRANLAENIQVISKAKVPIVKFISSYGASLSSGLCSRSGRLDPALARAERR